MTADPGLPEHMGEKRKAQVAIQHTDAVLVLPEPFAQSGENRDGIVLSAAGDDGIRRIGPWRYDVHGYAEKGLDIGGHDGERELVHIAHGDQADMYAGTRFLCLTGAGRSLRMLFAGRGLFRM
jgi:hypothetical protein